MRERAHLRCAVRHGSQAPIGIANRSHNQHTARGARRTRLLYSGDRPQCVHLAPDYTRRSQRGLGARERCKICAVRGARCRARRQGAEADDLCTYVRTGILTHNRALHSVTMCVCSGDKVRSPPSGARRLVHVVVSRAISRLVTDARAHTQNKRTLRFVAKQFCVLVLGNGHITGKCR